MDNAGETARLGHAYFHLWISRWKFRAYYKEPLARFPTEGNVHGPLQFAANFRAISAMESVKFQPKPEITLVRNKLDSKVASLQRNLDTVRQFRFTYLVDDAVWQFHHRCAHGHQGRNSELRHCILRWQGPHWHFWLSKSQRIHAKYSAIPNQATAKWAKFLLLR